MNNLQEIINKKARDRAEKEVREFLDILKKNDKLGKLLSNYIIKFNDKTEDIRSAFWSSAKPIPLDIIEKLTEIYIPEESKKFIKKVEELSDQIEELKNYNYE